MQLTLTITLEFKYINILQEKPTIIKPSREANSINPSKNEQGRNENQQRRKAQQ